jgi:hypothetical protein
MLQTQTSDLDAIVKKVFADAEAHRKTQFWQHSLGVANAALATATSAEVDGASVILTASSAVISERNAALACFDASTFAALTSTLALAL